MSREESIRYLQDELEQRGNIPGPTEDRAFIFPKSNIITKTIRTFQKLPNLWQSILLLPKRNHRGSPE